jgi:DNA-binding PadR family transcriptional regulator
VIYKAVVNLLSNAELIILSLINEKPTYPYEIEKQIETRNMRHWVKIGIASIYQVLARLSGKGYVEFQTEREGKAPERKRYSITATGQAELKESVKNLLVQIEGYYLNLNVAIEGSDILEPEELKKCLAQRLEKARSSLKISTQNYLELKDQKLKAGAIARNVMLFREAEVKFLEDLLTEL